MYVMDDRFATAVAFIEGFNQANDGRILSGFQSYVIDQINGGERSSVYWASIIAWAESPSKLDTDEEVKDLPPEMQLALIDRMVDLLMGYDACRTGEELSPVKEIKGRS
jgi:hypothetical protein